MIPAVPRSCISTASARTACNCGHAGIQPIDLISLFLDAKASLNYIQNLHFWELFGAGQLVSRAALIWYARNLRD